MEDTRLMFCDFCKKSYPLTEIRYMPKGDARVALCEKCRSKHPGTEKASETAKTAMGAKKLSAPIINSSIKVKKPKMVESGAKKGYYCEKCNYKFKFENDGVTNLKCPYCGSNERVKDL